MKQSTTKFTFSSFCLENNIDDITSSLMATKSNSSICSRSLSIEEPMPSASCSTPLLRCNPNIMDLKISVHASELETVSETKHNPVDEWDTNPQALLSDDSSSPIACGHIPTYSDLTTSTVVTSPCSCSSIDACFIPLSPINHEQSLRNLSYHRRHASLDRIMCEIPDIVDEVITKCNSDNASDATSSNNTNHGQTNTNNNDKSKQHMYNSSNNNDDNDNNSSGSQHSHNNNHNNNGDDEKKREDDKQMDADDDETDEKEEKEDDEEDDKEDDEPLTPKNNKRKLNKNAAPFEPLTIRNRSRSASAAKKLLTIDEYNVFPPLITAKSAPMAPVATPPYIKPVSLNALTPSCDAYEDEVKSTPNPVIAPIATNICVKNKKQYVYTPNTAHRAQGFIKIHKYVTTTLLPQRIAESIENLYDFMAKSTAIARCNDNILYYRNVITLNYGFHDKQNGQSLYLVADKQSDNTAKRKCKYAMRQRVYTKRELCNMYKLRGSALPPANHETLTDFSDRVNEIFSDSTTVCKKYIFHTKWHKLPVIHAMNNSKRYNKQRLTFSMTKTEFNIMLERYVRNEHNTKAMIPIVMFNCNGSRVEYVQIVQIRENIAIGISYVYNANKNSIKATGIHLNKENILHQHQLYAPHHHDCRCLDDFRSNIDDLHIGNPDDDKNRVKDLKKKNDALNEIIKVEKKQIGSLITDNNALRNRMLQLEQYIYQIHNYGMPPISPMCPQYIQCITPQSMSSTSLSVLVSPSSYSGAQSVPNSSTASTSQSVSSYSSFSQCANAANGNYSNQ